MDVWVGFLTVTGPRETEFLAGNAGACVWIATQSEGREFFDAKAKSAMSKLGLGIMEMEHVRKVDSPEGLPDSLFDLLSEAQQNETSVVCGTWHYFTNFEA